ncbi:MAG TPA: cytochrome c, partial [Pseudohaliea sp.]|nr:cytochrome c [Pseudohaliea sp.]
MPMTLKRTFATAAVAASLVAAPLVSAHLDSDEPLQSYRQSYFTLLAMNFGPIADMVKGDIPWDLEKLQGWADDVEDVTELDLLRGFAPGSEKGTTRAKPAIWENMDDFEGKLADLRDAAEAL